MKRQMFLIAGIVCCILFISENAFAGISYTFTPTPADAYDLDHYKYYSWRIDWSLPAGEKIVGASLFFDNIRNWDNHSNDLYIHLLDYARHGESVKVGYDYQGGGDYFASYNYKGNHIRLAHYEDLPATPQDLEYYFTQSEISVLTEFLDYDNFGIGFDPDCHYYNDGIHLKIETETVGAPVPEPATILLLGSGLVGLAGFRKKYRKT